MIATSSTSEQLPHLLISSVWRIVLCFLILFGWEALTTRCRPALTDQQDHATSWHRYRPVIVLIIQATAAFRLPGLQSRADADDARFIVFDQTSYLVPFLNI